MAPLKTKKKPVPKKKAMPKGKKKESKCCCADDDSPSSSTEPSSSSSESSFSSSETSSCSDSECSDCTFECDCAPAARKRGGKKRAQARAAKLNVKKPKKKTGRRTRLSTSYCSSNYSTDEDCCPYRATKSGRKTRV